MHICMRHIAQICNSQRITNQPVLDDKSEHLLHKASALHTTAVDEHKLSTSDFTTSLMSQNLMHNIYISSNLSSSAGEFSTSRYVAFFCPANNRHSGVHQRKKCCTQRCTRRTDLASAWGPSAQPAGSPALPAAPRCQHSPVACTPRHQQTELPLSAGAPGPGRQHHCPAASKPPPDPYLPTQV